MGLLAVPSRKPDDLERPSTMGAVSRLWLAQGSWLWAKHGAGSTQILSLYSPSPCFFPRYYAVSALGCTVVGADGTHPDAPLPLWLGGQHRRPRHLARRIARIAGSAPVVRDDAWRASLPLCAVSARGTRRFAPSRLAAADSKIAPDRAAHTFGALREIRVSKSSLPYIRHTSTSIGSERPRCWPVSFPPVLPMPAPMARRAPSTGDPSWAVERGVPTSRGHSAVQADSVASGSPARLRACRACSWRPRWPRSYGIGLRLYHVARFCSDPPPAPPPGSVAKPRTALQAPIGEGGGG